MKNIITLVIVLGAVIAPNISHGMMLNFIIPTDTRYQKPYEAYKETLKKESELKQAAIDLAKKIEAKTKARVIQNEVIQIPVIDEISATSTSTTTATSTPEKIDTLESIKQDLLSQIKELRAQINLLMLQRK